MICQVPVADRGIRVIDSILILMLFQLPPQNTGASSVTWPLFNSRLEHCNIREKPQRLVVKKLRSNLSCFDYSWDNVGLNQAPLGVTNKLPGAKRMRGIRIRIETSESTENTECSVRQTPHDVYTYSFITTTYAHITPSIRQKRTEAVLPCINCWNNTRRRGCRDTGNHHTHFAADLIIMITRQLPQVASPGMTVLVDYRWPILPWISVLLGIGTITAEINPRKRFIKPWVGS